MVQEGVKAVPVDLPVRAEARVPEIVRVDPMAKDRVETVKVARDRDRVDRDKVAVGRAVRMAPVGQAGPDVVDLPT